MVSDIFLSLNIGCRMALERWNWSVPRRGNYDLLHLQLIL